MILVQFWPSSGMAGTAELESAAADSRVFRSSAIDLAPVVSRKLDNSGLDVLFETMQLGLVQLLFREELRHQVSHLQVIQVREREVRVAPDADLG